MIVNVTKAAYLRDYKVYLEFDDGTKGIADLEDKAMRGGVFQPLNDVKYFRQLQLDADLGTICWPNGADLAPEALHERVRSAGTNGTASPQ